MSARPPARDQPSPEEIAELVAALRASVEAGRDRTEDFATSQPPVRSGHGQLVLVRIDGATARLSLRGQGQLLARREVPVAELVEHLERDGQSFATLAGLVEQ